MKRLFLLLTGLMLILAMGSALAAQVDAESGVNVVAEEGGIDVVMHMLQRGKNGEADFVPFNPHKPLLPVVGTVGGAAVDRYGLPTAGNFLDKLVCVASKAGSETSWVRMIAGVPTALKDAVHLYFTQNETEWKYQYSYEVEIDGVMHTVWAYLCQKPLAANGQTQPCLLGCYLDSGVNWDDEASCYTLGGKPLRDFTGSISIPVAVQAVPVTLNDVQRTPEMAFTLDATYNPWNSQTVSVIDWFRNLF